MNAGPPFPTASSPSQTRTLVCILGVVFGFIALAAVLSVTFILVVLAFDSPLRKTSTDLVMNLFIGGAAGMVPSIPLFGIGQLFHRARWGKAMWIAGIVAAALGIASYAASLGYAFFGG